MSKQPIEQHIKDTYDQLPYPAPEQSKRYTGDWSWADLNWIESLLPSSATYQQSFKRILIAGCGTGKEAFLMCNSFPDAEITAVDYSEESIRLAQDQQQENPTYKNIRFEVGNLTQDTENWAKADYYDFISCHGVMSYIPQTQNAFNTLSNCLASDGVFYLSVNGPTHVGVAIRQSFEQFGYASDVFHDTEETRQLIELFDRMRATPEDISNSQPAYLASDILTPFSLALPLSKWLDYAEKSNLHFISTTELVLNLSKTLAPGIFSRLCPKTRAEICKVIALNNVAPFHRIIFRKKADPVIPWTDFHALLNCEFRPTRLYTIQYPISTIDGEITLSGSISESHNINFKWPIDDTIVQLLKPYDGSQTIGDALESILSNFTNDQENLIEKIFMFYQLGMIKILNQPQATK